MQARGLSKLRVGKLRSTAKVNKAFCPRPIALRLADSLNAEIPVAATLDAVAVFFDQGRCIVNLKAVVADEPISCEPQRAFFENLWGPTGEHIGALAAMRPSSWHVGFGARQRGYDLQQE